MEIQWSLVIFASFMAVGAGTYGVSAILGEWFGLAKGSRTACMALSATAVVVGGLASMTHLGHIGLIFGVLANPTSGIFVEAVCSVALLAVIAVYLLAARRDAGAGTLKAIATVGLVPAVVLVVGVGTAYLMPARPAWDTLALPLVSLATAALAGCLAVMALNAASKGSSEDKAAAASLLRKLAIGAVAFQAVALIAWVASVGMAPYQDYSRSVERIVAGDLALLFWGFVVAAGIAVPAVAAFKKNAAGATLPFIAFVCVVCAAIAFRVIMFSVGSSVISFGF